MAGSQLPASHRQHRRFDAFGHGLVDSGERLGISSLLVFRFGGDCRRTLYLRHLGLAGRTHCSTGRPFDPAIFPQRKT